MAVMGHFGGLEARFLAVWGRLRGILEGPRRPRSAPGPTFVVEVAAPGPPGPVPRYMYKWGAGGGVRGEGGPPQGCKRRSKWLQEGSKRPPRGEVSERSGALSEGPGPQSPDRYISGGRAEG